MRIERNSMPSLVGLRSVGRTERPAPRPAAEKVSLSQTGELIQAAYRQLKALPATREALVERFRAAIQTGRYQTSAEATAQGIWAHLKGVK